MMETFTIHLDNLRNNGADLEISWENTKVTIPFKVDTDAKVMADIKSQLDGPSAGTYYAAARYYFEEKKDLNQALDWVNKSLEKGGDKFWILRMKALILADLGRTQEAITVAEASTALATKEGNKDYPAMNAKSIAEWKNKK
jgi:tetratricopeptide (TPR) repeat protein